MSVKLNRRKCMVCGNTGLPLFKVPHDPVRLRKWLILLKVDPILQLNPVYILSHGKVCPSHFSIWAFTNTTKKRLIATALPVLQQSPVTPDLCDEDLRLLKSLENYDTLVPDTDKENPELHVKEKEALKNSLSETPHGTIPNSVKNSENLRPAAVPSRNRPDSNSTCQQKNKKHKLAEWKTVIIKTEPLEIDDASPQDDLCSQSVTCGVLTYIPHIDRIQSAVASSQLATNNSVISTFSSTKNSSVNSATSLLPCKDFNFSVLSQNLNQVHLPDGWWTINALPEYIICSKMNCAYMAERRVVVDKCLNVKIFLKQREILDTKGFDIQLSSFEDLTNAVKKVHRYLLCKGADDPKLSQNCLVYSDQRRTDVPLSHYCFTCKRAEPLSTKGT